MINGQIIEYLRVENSPMRHLQQLPFKLSRSQVQKFMYSISKATLVL